MRDSDKSQESDKGREKRDKNNGLVVNGSEEWHRNSFKAIVNSLTHDCGRRRRRPLFAAFLSDIV